MADHRAQLLGQPGYHPARGRWMCPLHWPDEQYLCGERCLPTRDEFRRLCILMANYWRERQRLGWKPARSKVA